MDVAVLCERSAVVREEFARRGHSAISVDTAPCERPDGLGVHWQGDALEALVKWRAGIVIAHPECTFLASSGLHWNKRIPGRSAKTDAALAFVEKILRADAACVCVENPRGCITTRLAHVLAELGYIRQSVQPYEFGDDASKETVLLLKNLAELVKDPAKRVPGRMVMWKGKLVERWSNQCDSGQNRLGPSETRSMDRARTYPGIASAMAEQWGLV